METPPSLEMFRRAVHKDIARALEILMSHVHSEEFYLFLDAICEVPLKAKPMIVLLELVMKAAIPEVYIAHYIYLCFEVCHRAHEDQKVRLLSLFVKKLIECSLISDRKLFEDLRKFSEKFSHLTEVKELLDILPC